MATITKARCACGRTMSKYSTTCNACHKAKLDAIHTEALAIVATGKCPQCGSPLKRNSSISGWWQCCCYGSVPMRAPEHRHLPACGFQCFTE